MLFALVTAAEEGQDVGNPLLPAYYDIIWSGVCMLVIVLVVWLYALPRITTVLDARSAAIEGNIARADEAQRRAEAMLEEYTANLADARREAGEIRDAAREDGKKILVEAKQSAAAEDSRLTSAAHAQIDAERQAAAVALRTEVGDLALHLAGSVIQETLSDEAKAKAVVDRFIADLDAPEKAAT